MGADTSLLHDARFFKFHGRSWWPTLLLMLSMLGWPRSFFFPAPSPHPLRNLTLGVLIVTGGTLAALPFRRGPAIPDASSPVNRQPTQATGPLQSALTPATRLVSASQKAITTAPQAVGEIPGYQELVSQESPHPDQVTPSAYRSRLHVQPLTYDDLMSPISRPGPLQNRYQALVEVQQQAIEQDQGDAMALPSVESLAPPPASRMAAKVRGHAAESCQRKRCWCR